MSECKLSDFPYGCSVTLSGGSAYCHGCGKHYTPNMTGIYLGHAEYRGDVLSKIKMDKPEVCGDCGATSRFFYERCCSDTNADVLFTAIQNGAVKESDTA